MFFKGLGPRNPWKRSAAKFRSFSTNSQPISLDTDLFRTIGLYFLDFLMHFTGFSKNRGPKIPTCQSRGIGSWSFLERSRVFRLAELVSTNQFSAHLLHDPPYSTTGLSKKRVWRFIFNIILFPMFIQMMLV